MSDPVQRLADAEREAAAARARLSITLATLRVRMEPRALVREARLEATDRGRHAAKVGTLAALRNPGTTAAAAVLAGLFLMRRRIVRRLRRSRGATGGLPPR